MDQHDENSRLQDGKPVCNTCGAPIRNEEDIGAKWTKEGICILMAGVAVVVLVSDAVITAVGGTMIAGGAICAAYGATGTFVDGGAIRHSWIKTGLSIITMGIAIIGFVSEAVVAVVGGLTIAGGAIVAVYGATGTSRDGAVEENDSKCYMCGNIIQETENAMATFDDPLKGDGKNAATVEISASDSDVSLTNTEDNAHSTENITTHLLSNEPIKETSSACNDILQETQYVTAVQNDLLESNTKTFQDNEMSASDSESSLSDDESEPDTDDSITVSKPVINQPFDEPDIWITESESDDTSTDTDDSTTVSQPDLTKPIEEPVCVPVFRCERKSFYLPIPKSRLMTKKAKCASSRFDDAVKKPEEKSDIDDKKHSLDHVTDTVVSEMDTITMPEDVECSPGPLHDAEELDPEPIAIPEGVGSFISRFDEDVFQDVIQDVSDRKRESEELLVVEKIDKKIISSNVDIEMKDSIDEWTPKCDKDFIGLLEDKYKVVIKINFFVGDGGEIEHHLPQFDGPGDEYKAYGFSRNDTKLEAIDKNGKFEVKFCNSDITSFPADAMVNSSSPSLDMTGVLSGKVAHKAGSEVVKACRRHIKRNGYMEFGDVFSTKGGNLDFEYIIHVASPVWATHGKKKQPNPVLIEATKNVLKEANNKGLREIAMPAISAGGWGFPIEVSVSSILTGIKEYFEEPGYTGMLKYITLVDINPNVIKEVENAMQKIFGTHCVYDEETKQCKNEKTVTCKIIGGTSEIIEKVINELKRKCDGVCGPVKHYPATWSPMSPGEPYRLEAVAENSIDFIQLKDILIEYIPTVKIIKIERVQHPKLYDDMMAHKQKIIQEIGSWSDEFEMKLWHGTRKEAAEKIKHDTFRKPADKVHSVNGLWYGRGVYFGPTPKVSHTYTIPFNDDRNVDRRPEDGKKITRSIDGDWYADRSTEDDKIIYAGSAGNWCDAHSTEGKNDKSRNTTEESYIDHRSDEDEHVTCNSDGEKYIDHSIGDDNTVSHRKDGKKYIDHTDGDDRNVSRGTPGKGERYMFRSTVIVGKIKTYKNHKKAAAAAIEAPKGYHSIRVHDPHYGIEHVVFHETQACPDYLITYKV